MSTYTYTTLDNLLTDQHVTIATDVNDANQVVGYYYTHTGTVAHYANSFIYSGGVYTPLQNFGAFGTIANSINDSGQVVGYYTDSSNIDQWLSI